MDSMIRFQIIQISDLIDESLSREDSVDNWSGDGFAAKERYISEIVTRILRIFNLITM